MADNSKRRRRPLSELAAIVRPAGQPDAVRSFAHDELEDARQYAAAHDASVEMLAN